MGRQVGVHAADHAELVGVRGDLGEQLRDPLPALAVLSGTSTASPAASRRGCGPAGPTACRVGRAASACSRTCRRATVPRSCRGRSLAWPGPGNAGPSARAASPSSPRRPPSTTGRRRPGSRTPRRRPSSRSRRESPADIHRIDPLLTGYARDQSQVSELGAGEERLAERRPGRACRVGPARARGEIAEEREGAVALAGRRRPREGEPISPIDPTAHRRPRSRGPVRPGPRPAGSRTGCSSSRVPGPGRSSWPARPSPGSGRRSRTGRATRAPGRGPPAGRPPDAGPRRPGRRPRTNTASPSPARATAEPTGGSRSSRPLTNSTASRIASASSRRLLIRQTSVLSGSASKLRGVVGRVEPVGPAEHDPADQPLDRPAVVHELDRQGVEQLRVARRLAGGAEIVGRGTSPRPNRCSQTRLTITRAVSGFAGEASQSASSRRPLPVAIGAGVSAQSTWTSPRGTTSPGWSSSPRM